MPFRTPKPSAADRIATGAVAGMTGIAAWLAVQEIDRRLLDPGANDLVFLGGMVTQDDALIEPVGLAIHLANGAAAGAAYALLLHDRLPGPPVARGVTFILAEHLGLYPLMLLEDRHPSIRRGRLSRYWTGTAFFQQTIRHLAFGAVLSTLCGRWLGR